MKIWLQDLRWPEVEAYLAHDDTILLPVGSTEQHGRHLPLRTDTTEASEVAKAVAERTGVLVAPPCQMAGLRIIWPSREQSRSALKRLGR
jgi:creatinine amidohydrolase